MIREDGPVDATCGDGKKGTGHSRSSSTPTATICSTPLTRTGGLPGPCAKNEVVIRRDDSPARSPVSSSILCPAEPIAFTDADIILKDGDTVHVGPCARSPTRSMGGRAAATTRFPRDPDVRILEASVESDLARLAVR